MADEDLIESTYVALTPEQRNEVQGDIWSKGFPKYFETYYLFQIGTGQEKAFAQCLGELAEKPEDRLSTLAKVKQDHKDIAEEIAKANAESRAKRTLPKANAVIAFTQRGLDSIQKALPKSLELEKISKTDPGFYDGMMSPKIRGFLHDPELSALEPLFQKPDEIHGLLKIGGSSKTEVDKRLKLIQGILKHDKGVIKDVRGNLSADQTDTRMDGWTRPDPNRGKEHFGFEDGISQPLMNGIDDMPQKPIFMNFSFKTMDTDPKRIIVMDGTFSEGAQGVDIRPGWMKNGSFLVFRKLEQDVKAFNDLTSKFDTHGCKNAEQMGAKLMGRWKSGAPLTLTDFNTEDIVSSKANLDAAKLMNNFGYPIEGNFPACPVSSHIRKTNQRSGITDHNSSDSKVERSRIIRNGIPYGKDYQKDEADGSKRGLLFACYQAHIEDGFQNMQQIWCNDVNFPRNNIGLDPIIGQGSGEMTTFITDIGLTRNDVEVKIPSKLVTLKGGDYFFVPSISALATVLSATPKP